MFLGKDAAALQRELTEYLKRPEHRSLLEQQQRDEFCAARDLHERNVESSFVAKLSTLDVSLQRKLRPLVKHDLLRRLMISMSSTSDSDFQSWIQNPRVLEMFTKAQRLLRKGHIQEKELEQFLHRYLASVHPHLRRGHSIALTSRELLAPLNEHLEERALGNAAYRKGDLDTAMARYERALGILNLVRGRHARDQEEIQRCCNDVHLNIAAVHMQKGLYGAAIEACTGVLEHDPSNVKALERRARAHRAVMDARLQKCAFAKLLGDDLEYYIRKYEVTLGRKNKSTELDVVLGDNTNVSRNHASIRYNFAEGAFELVVRGKNGVYVEGVLYTPSSPPVRLKSQNFIQMGDKGFFFLLPKSNQT